MDHVPTDKTTLAEQSQNPGQAGAASTSVSKDIGDAPTGGELKGRLDTIDASTSEGGGATKVGGEGDQHEKAAERQP